MPRSTGAASLTIILFHNFIFIKKKNFKINDIILISFLIFILFSRTAIIFLLIGFSVIHIFLKIIENRF